MKIEIYNGSSWDDVTLYVKRGLQFNSRLDEELDTSIVIINNTRQNYYEPFTKIKITVGSKTFNYYIDFDEVTSLGKNEALFQHTLSLIEPTKILERYDCDNLRFTQPLNGTTYYMDDVLTRIKDVTPLEMTTKHSSTRLISLDSALLSDLSTKVAPEFNFQQNTLLEVFNEVLRYDDSISRMKDYGVLTRDKFNELKTLITTSSLTNYGQSLNSEHYGSSMFLNGENIVSDKIDIYPSEPEYITFTSEDLILTTENIILKTPKPIYYIDKVVMLDKCYLWDDINNQYTDTFKIREYDISQYIFEKSNYDLLKPLSTGITIGKDIALFYSQGDNKIEGWGNKTPVIAGIWDMPVIERLANTIANDFITEYIPPNTFTYRSKIAVDLGNKILEGKIPFRIYYHSIDLQTLKLRQYKSIKQINNLMIKGNQGARIININRLLDNSKNTINRLGNGDLVIEKVSSSIDDVFQVGQYTSDKYIITSVENIVHDETYIKSKALLTKNFNRLSSFIGVNQEYRQFEIPDQPLKRDLHYDEFVHIGGSGVVTSDPSVFSSNGRLLLKNTFSNTATKKINGILVTTKYDVGSTVTNIGRFLIGLDAMSGGTSNIFNWSFDHNKLVYGEITKTSDNLYTYLNPKNYTLDDGTLKYLSFNLINNDSFNSNLSNYILPIDTVAHIPANKNDLITLYPALSGLGENFYVYFDVAQYPTVCYNVHYYRNSFLVETHTDSVISRDDALKTILGGLDDTLTSVALGYEKLEPKKKTISDAQLSKFFVSSNLITNSGNFVVYKDAGEVLGMTYQLHYVSEDGYFIGNSFINNNAFFQDSKTNLYLYTSTTETYDYSSQKCKGTRYGSAWGGFSTSSLTNGFSITRSAGGTVTSWAIGDYDGNLYVGTNGNITLINFIFKNKL